MALYSHDASAESVSAMERGFEPVSSLDSPPAETKEPSADVPQKPLDQITPVGLASQTGEGRKRLLPTATSEFEIPISVIPIEMGNTASEQKTENPGLIVSMQRLELQPRPEALNQPKAEDDQSIVSQRPTTEVQGPVEASSSNAVLQRDAMDGDMTLEESDQVQESPLKIAKMESPKPVQIEQDNEDQVVNNTSLAALSFDVLEEYAAQRPASGSSVERGLEEVDGKVNPEKMIPEKADNELPSDDDGKQKDQVMIEDLEQPSVESLATASKVSVDPASEPLGGEYEMLSDADIKSTPAARKSSTGKGFFAWLMGRK